MATCPECRRRTFTGTDDLRVELVHDGTVHSFRHLYGARCTRCGAQTLEPYDQAEMEEELAARFTADYAAHVSNVGKGTVGTYWPKDVQRLMGLRKGVGLRIQVLDRRTMVVRVE